MDTKVFRLALTGVAVAATCAILPAVAGATNYVAMGDSYTSGPGIEPYSPTNPAACGVSERSYPFLVAQALNLKLTDVSCGGAKTIDETESQLQGQPPQDEALSGTTEIVTLGMGGNDRNLFGTLVEGCTIDDFYLKAANPHACENRVLGIRHKNFEEDKIEQEAALRHIKELAPNAKVFVVGYPEIIDMPCENFPWYPKDALWFRNKVQKVGNKEIKEGALANGAIFVDTFKASEGHNACQPVGTRWIEPLFNSLTGVAVHPNAIGQEQDSYDVEYSMLKAGVR